MQCYADRPPTVDAAFRAAVAAAPEAEALVEGTTRRSYAALDALVGRLAPGLWARGVRQANANGKIQKDQSRRRAMLDLAGAPRQERPILRPQDRPAT